MRFEALGLIPELLRALDDLGFAEPTPIQQQTVPLLLAGKDVLGAAQTGTGKTASFALPMLQRLAPFANTSPSPARHPTRALVLAPTRELVLQIDEAVASYGKYLPLRHVVIYGGVDIDPQIAALRHGAEIVIATPGRLLDHLEQKTVRLNQVQFLVFDEADRMLDMGFLPDIRRIVAQLPADRQTALFSATFSPEILKLAKDWLRDPEVVEVAPRNTVSTTIEHRVLWVEQEKKREALVQLLQRHEGQALVFVDTKLACGRLAAYLQRAHLNAQPIHGDRTQQQRQETLEAFRAGKVRVLVATDVAARGLDVAGLPLVINFSLPSNPEDYVHRVGRTGRAGMNGLALSLVAPEEQVRLSAIEKLLGQTIPSQAHQTAFSEANSTAQVARGVLSTQKRASKTQSRASFSSAPEKTVHDDVPEHWTRTSNRHAEPNRGAEFWPGLPWTANRRPVVPVLLGGTGRRDA